MRKIEPNLIESIIAKMKTMSDSFDYATYIIDINKPKNEPPKSIKN